MPDLSLQMERYAFPYASSKQDNIVQALENQ